MANTDFIFQGKGKKFSVMVAMKDLIEATVSEVVMCVKETKYVFLSFFSFLFFLFPPLTFCLISPTSFSFQHKMPFDFCGGPQDIFC